MATAETPGIDRKPEGVREKKCACGFRVTAQTVVAAVVAIAEHRRYEHLRIDRDGPWRCGPVAD